MIPVFVFVVNKVIRVFSLLLQISRPELIFLYSELAREKQLIANVVKKLESLGGTGCGDLCAFETVDPNAFVYSEHGQNALQYAMKSILGYTEPLVPPPRNYAGHFFKGSVCFDFWQGQY